MKRCTCCGERKPLDDFYKATAGSDGREAICKTCRKAKSQEWRRENKDRHLASSRSWYERNRARSAASTKAWREANPERVAEADARRRRRYPAKRAARVAVNNALLLGRLEKPDSCEGCGEPTESRHLHGHHDDYSKPLEVRWLCVTCHKAEHAEQERAAAGAAT